MAKTINSRQIKSVYWPAWRDAEQVLLNYGGYSKTDTEEIRKEIHLEVTGAACSSKELTNRALDAVLGKFAAISSPRDGQRQVDLADQACNRVRFKITEIQKRMNLDGSYIETMAVNITRTSYKFCTEDQLKNILKALVYHEGRTNK